MRIARSTLIGTAVAVALFGREELGNAQAAAAGATAAGGQLQEVVVTGIRYSLEQSLEVKRESNEVIEVVTAEDIGKMPDKNVADALQRLPGVTISSAGATEGGFDEADRVSLRGTAPGLTLTLINGHNVASGDWFVLNQTGTVGRSVSYTLLPSEIVKQAVVYMSSEASLPEGGAAGTVDIVTRKPLEFNKQQTIQVSAGAVYADLPGQWSPQFSALGNWMNDDKTFGVLGQIFYEQRDLRRDGQELLNYDTIKAGSPIALAHPDLAGVSYPGLIGATLFQQQRSRQGGLIDFEFKPNDQWTFDLNGFYSKLEAPNQNNNYLLWGSNILSGGTGQAPNPGYVVQQNTLTSATFTGVAGKNYGVYDQISRPDEGSDTYYADLDVAWKATDQLRFFGQLGVTEGHGQTPRQDVSETVPGTGNGASYTLYGITSAASWNLGNTINTTPTPGGVPVGFGWIFGDQNMDVVDKETYVKIDGAFDLKRGVFDDFKFGVRYADHQRNLWNVIGQGPGCQGNACPPTPPPLPAAQDPFNTANYPTGNVNYPSNFGYGLGGPFPTNIWYWTPSQLAAYDLSYTNRNPVTRADWTSDYGLEEKDTSLYLQLDFKGSNWSGNFGLRYVNTKESVRNNIGASASDPDAITTSAFGVYKTQQVDNTYNNVLPTANFKINITPELVGRATAGQAIARPDYSALASSLSFTGIPVPGNGGSGHGSNPNLKPILSTNVDLGLEWYFAPRALLSGDVFYMNLKNYVSYGVSTQTFFTFTNFCPTGCFLPFQISSPIEADGRVYGVQLSYQQPIAQYFGVILNYTYADGAQTSQLPPSGDNRLVGTSKNTGNAIAYFETAHFGARVAYNYRSSFFSGLDRSTAFSQGAVGTWDASFNWNVNDNFSVVLQGLNLNNPRLKYYAQNEEQPRAFYLNGSQYYVNLVFKL